MTQGSFLEICRFLEITPFHLANLIRRGQIIPSEKGQRLFISYDSLENFVEDRGEIEPLSPAKHQTALQVSSKDKLELTANFNKEIESRETVEVQATYLPAVEKATRALVEEMSPALELLLKIRYAPEKALALLTSRTEESLMARYGTLQVTLMSHGYSDQVDEIFRANGELLEESNRNFDKYCDVLDSVLRAYGKRGEEDLAELMADPGRLSTTRKLIQLQRNLPKGVQGSIYKSEYADQKLIGRIEGLGYDFPLTEAVLTKGFGLGFINSRRTSIDFILKKCSRFEGNLVRETVKKLVGDGIVESPRGLGYCLPFPPREWGAAPLVEYVKEFYKKTNG